MKIFIQFFTGLVILCIAISMIVNEVKQSNVKRAQQAIERAQQAIEENQKTLTITAINRSNRNQPGGEAPLTMTVDNKEHYLPPGSDVTFSLKPGGHSIGYTTQGLENNFKVFNLQESETWVFTLGYVDDLGNQKFGHFWHWKREVKGGTATRSDIHLRILNHLVPPTTPAQGVYQQVVTKSGDMGLEANLLPQIQETGERIINLFGKPDDIKTNATKTFLKSDHRGGTSQIAVRGEFWIYGPLTLMIKEKRVAYIWMVYSDKDEERPNFLTIPPRRK